MRNPEAAKKMAIEHEGRTCFGYLDTEGKFTIGIGNYLPTLDSVQALKSWSHADGRAATSDEVAAAYRRICAEPSGYRADHYSRLTDLRISDEEIDSLWDRTFAAFEAGLRRVFPTFDSFPEGPQLGLFDIIYQAGESGIKRGFPNLCKAANSNPPDWYRAAEESHRLKSSAKRNSDTFALFRSGITATE